MKLICYFLKNNIEIAMTNRSRQKDDFRESLVGVKGYQIFVELDSELTAEIKVGKYVELR